MIAQVGGMLQGHVLAIDHAACRLGRRLPEEN